MIDTTNEYRTMEWPYASLRRGRIPGDEHAFSAAEYKEHAEALMPALMPLYTALNPDTYGGAVLLGVDGVCIISHGSTGATAADGPPNIQPAIPEDLFP